MNISNSIVKDGKMAKVRPDIYMPVSEDEKREIAHTVARTREAMMARQEREEIADRMERALLKDLLLDTLEHEATGHGRVIDAERARATPCKCFQFEGETYAWSPGVLGLISSKKNPEQLREFCALGCLKASPGTQKRFKQLKGAIGEAHEEWKRKGGDLAGWWDSVASALERHQIEL